MKEMQLRDAKAGLSSLIDDAARGEPCIITRRGRKEAVILGYEEWQRLSHVPSFGRLLMSRRSNPAIGRRAIAKRHGASSSRACTWLTPT